MLKGALAAVGVAFATGLVSARAVLAAWNAAAFRAEDPATALQGLLGTSEHTPSDAVRLQAPDDAENAAAVRVTVEVDLPNVRSISLIASGNPYPLVASFELGPRAEGFISTSIKMAQTADVVAVVKTDDAILSAAKRVNAAAGRCVG
ncbi:thiosulfate oxidation carrier protein SoxY [Thiococcus pfennigii]|uniref:thiosulfate oxidation carrier protein SoxY n=1 Tax=Thiococcus pfennigii TaxID=1057 RepID=UPI0030B8D98D